MQSRKKTRTKLSTTNPRVEVTKQEEHEFCLRILPWLYYKARVFLRIGRWALRRWNGNFRFGQRVVEERESQFHAFRGETRLGILIPTFLYRRTYCRQILKAYQIDNEGCNEPFLPASVTKWVRLTGWLINRSAVRTGLPSHPVTGQMTQQWMSSDRNDEEAGDCCWTSSGKSQGIIHLEGAQF